MTIKNPETIIYKVLLHFQRVSRDEETITQEFPVIIVKLYID